MLKAIAFDLFGTVFNLENVPKEEIRDYIRQVKLPEWQPLVLPQSWNFLEAHPDSAEGIARLRSRYRVVTCSNGPVKLTQNILDLNGIEVDGIADFRMVKRYKPHQACYMLACDVAGCDPYECMMVTGNEGSPDIEGARAIGMQAVMIRQPGCVKDIIALAESLGC